MKLSDIYILKTKNAVCHCIIGGISKSKAINLIQNIESRTLQKIIKSNF